jgi:DNA topoisomerase-1
LATDPDREGEAIAWHFCEMMREKKALTKKHSVHRVVFHEITKKAVSDAIAQPREISMDLVDAQQARRALDYLVGFNLSPLLWKKIRYGLSAGRVQSPALRMIVSREEEIEKFIIQEYWSITANNRFAKQEFSAKLITYQGDKLTQFSFTKEDEVQNVKDHLLNEARGKLTAVKVEKKQRKRNPAPPFTTSTLQQEASRKLWFSAKQIMMIAQKLYEAGYITYMRTDSVNLATEAINELRQTILQHYGETNLPDKPNFYKTKSKNAQEAHEAIRPTLSSNTPEKLGKNLNPEQAKLYGLIWRRTIASQMVPAILDTVTVDLSCGSVKNLFRANGSVIVKPGFLSVYQEDQDDTKHDDDKMLPTMKVGDKIELIDIDCNQHFTEPPPRYSEASLVKALEEYGIGRPSTYASIIDTLISRTYAILENKRFRPTDVGRVVNKFLTSYFPKYVDYEFTAQLENELDDIADGKYDFLKLMREFWQPFHKLIEEIATSIKRADVTEETLDTKCPKCSKPLILKLGKKGRFIGCSGYPDCDYTANVDGEKQPIETEVVADRSCPECQSPLHIKLGRYGKFIGCSSYPKCKFMEPLEKPSDTGIICPICSQGTMLKRKSRYNKYFYSCSKYPKCKYAVWNEPLLEKCPQCGWKILTKKITKRNGEQKACPQKECGYVQ